MKDIITVLAKNLSNEHILWGIGGSVLLQSYGIVEEVHDLDIIISKYDIEKALEVLDSIAIRKNIPIKKEYATEHFHVYEFEGISFDVMSSFRIKHIKGTYEFILDNESIGKKEKRDNIIVPFTTLEDWWIAYKLMIGRESKVELIETYLSTNGIEHPSLLRRALEQELPDGVRVAIEELLDTCK